MIGTPILKPSYVPKERNVLDLFSVEGEGGYNAPNFTFMFKSSAFFNTDILPSVRSMCSVKSDIKSIVVGTQTFNFLPNVLRISLGNHNACIMYRDGSIDIGGSRSSFPYLASVMADVRDTFTPSTYATGGIQYKQMLLLKNKDLVVVDCYNKKNTTLLSNVSKFLTKNQGHRCDAIIGMMNGDVYHVWVGPSPLQNEQAGNATESGVRKIDGIKHTDLLFCTIGDPPCNATFCKKSEPNKLYKFIKGYGTDFQIKGFYTTPIDSMTLSDPNEYYVHGMAQEFNALYLTNKRVRHRSSADGGGQYSVGYTTSEWINQGWDYVINDHVDKLYAKRICTPTAYSMIIEDVFGKYWKCDNSGYILTQPERYPFFNDLKTYLEPIRAAL